MKPVFITYRRVFGWSAAILVLLRASITFAGTATLNPAGSVSNWNDATKWTTTPSGFVPNNGNGGQNWDVTIPDTAGVNVNLAVTVDSLTLAGQLQGTQTINIAGDFTWSDGFMNGTGITNANGDVTLSGDTKALNQRTLNLGDATIWTAGWIQVNSGAVINNKTGATWLTSYEGRMERATGSSGTFNNAGFFLKSGSTTTEFRSMTFNNTGTLQVSGGTLLFNSTGGTHTGAFSVSNGATLEFSGTHNFNIGTTFIALGGSTLRFTGGTSTLSTFLSSSGAISLSNSATVTASSVFSADTLSLANTATLNGSGNVTVSGALTWTGGSLGGAGIVNANGGLVLTSSTSTRTLTRTLNATGNTTQSVVLNVNTGGVINHLSSGTWIMNASSSHLQGTGGIFNNAGIVRRTFGGSGTVDIAFNNSGTVDIAGGGLYFNGGGTHSGIFQAANGGTVGFNGGTHNITASANLSGMVWGSAIAVGAGTVNLAAPSTLGGRFTVAGTGTFNVNATTNIGELDLSSGTLAGTGAITVSGIASWTGGTMSGAGITRLNGQTNIWNAGTKTLDGRTLQIGGNADWSSGPLNLSNGATLHVLSGGTWTNSFNLTMGGTGASTLRIDGTYTKGASTTISLGSHITLNNTGALNVNGGTLNIAGPVTQLAGTTLTGGTWNIRDGATLSLTGGNDITVNEATVLLDGAGSAAPRFTNALNENRGSLTLQNDRDLTTAGALTNSGNLTIDDAATVLTVDGAYTQTNGTTTLADGATMATPAFHLEAGTLRGSGTIDGSLTSDAHIVPGLSAGTMNVTGNLSLLSNSYITFELGGTAADAQYDQLTVGGAATLDGELYLSQLNGFTPSIGDSFTLLTAGSISGYFDNALPVSGHTAPISYMGLEGHVVYQSDSVVVNFGTVPEPGTGLLGGVGALILAGRRRRARKPQGRR